MSSQKTSWASMTNSQRSAALQLGYTQDSWDNAELNVSPPRTASKRTFTRSRRESPERAPVIPTPGSFSDLTGVTPAARGSSGSADVKMPTVSKSSLMASMSGALQAGKKSDQMATLAANKKKNRGPSFHQRMKMMEDDLHEQAKHRQKLQRRLQKKLDEKFGDGSGGVSEQLRMTPKKDFEMKEEKAHKADEELGHVEKELHVERQKLDAVMEELMAIRRQVDHTNGELTGTQRKLNQLLGLMEELLQGVLRKKDGNTFSNEARDELQRTVHDPIEKFFQGNNNIRSYIFEKLDNMSGILPRWEVDEDLTGPSMLEDADAQLMNEFKDWTQADFDKTLRNQPDQAGGVATVVGVYRRHIVAEPPQPPHKHTRTAGVETEDGEFFMLGVYHGYDGVRSEEEIASCDGRLVKVVGTKNDSTPPNPDDEGDILAAITPHISEIRTISVIG